MKQFYLKLRIKKLYWILVAKIFYKDWPIDLASAEINKDGIYELPLGRKVLAEFDLKERHYVVLEK